MTEADEIAETLVAAAREIPKFGSHDEAVAWLRKNDPLIAQESATVVANVAESLMRWGPKSNSGVMPRAAGRLRRYSIIVKSLIQFDIQAFDRDAARAIVENWADDDLRSGEVLMTNVTSIVERAG